MKKYPNFRRTLAFLLVLAMLVPCISMTAFSQDIPCAEDGCSGKYLNGICSKDAAHFEAAPIEGGIYQISNAGQLYWFAALVNSGENEYSGDNGDAYNAALTNDIVINADMSAENKLSWTPIGLYTSAREYVAYSGTFDGAGYTIHGLYYDNTNYNGRNAGLFGMLDSNGVVKNLTLADSVIKGATDIGGIVSHNAGSVIGCTQSGTVTGIGATGGIVCRNLPGAEIVDCANTGAVSGSTTGGIAAENNGEITGCENSGAVTGTSSVGGIVGMNDGAVADSLNTANVNASITHVGGVVGNLVGGEIISCGNKGDVAGASDYIGGVAGVCSGASITKSYNEGKVTGDQAKSDAVGGVVGAIDGTNTTESAITNCYNTGSVTGRSWVGGIAGVSGYQNTPKTVTYSNCYNTGAVEGTSHVGAVAGKLSKGTVSGTYYLAGSAQNSVTGAAEATAEKFASGEIAYLLNGSTSEGALVWLQTIGKDASPKFTGLVVYYDADQNPAYYNKDVHEHSWSDWTVTTPATCTEAGEEKRTCECGESETREIPVLDHEYVNGKCECGAELKSRFVDVLAGSYYFDPVEWAVEKGITTGVDETHFNPTGSSLRAAVVTFLWRAAGSPEPTTTENPFTDVQADAYYYKAVLWAVEKGITNGTSETEFSPFQDCTRSQVVTFLWRAQGSPESTSEVSFEDVEPGRFYSTAVAWAVEKGVTNGLDDTTFGVAATCNRAQVVTFLYRSYK